MYDDQVTHSLEASLSHKLVSNRRREWKVDMHVHVDCWYGNTQRTQTSLARHQQSFSVRHSFPAAGPCHARSFLSRFRQTDRLASTLVRII